VVALAEFDPQLHQCAALFIAFDTFRDQFCPDVARELHHRPG
jgi:hypothetical protein